LQQWFPIVFVDLHEMAPDSTYYFAPEADPYNPHLAKDQRASLTLFGRNNGKWFDHFGFDYFTREVQRQGRGIVIGFTADPTYRAYTDGAELLFMNAIFRSSGHAGSIASEEEAAP
jgi:hypothetical protein